DQRQPVRRTEVINFIFDEPMSKVLVRSKLLSCVSIGLNQIKQVRDPMRSRIFCRLISVLYLLAVTAIVTQRCDLRGAGFRFLHLFGERSALVAPSLLLLGVGECHGKLVGPYRGGR